MSSGSDATSVSPTWPEVFIAWIGRTVAWLGLLMVLLSFTVVVLRYGFNLGWIWMQETVTYLHATIFMLAAAWALQTNDHVRVDIFYRERSPRQKAWVNAIGTLLFLVPVCVFLLIKAGPYVATAWSIRESSKEASGLPWVYLLKTLLLLLPALLLIQAGNGLYRNYQTLRGKNA
ncbi:TRAP transporter small permease subunit [Elongatibacter sediminis]|uniref:TRAP transporter small permease protein n=1 Tax=Elongatibacter sediminis TaxID=3119006 RepID=A0AAW9RCF4_9GAMM